MRRCLVLLLVLSTTPAWADDPEGEGGGEAAPAESGGGATPGQAGGSGTGRGADKGTLGVGIMIGEPTGICGRLYLKDDQAVQGGVGVAFVGSGFQIHADYAFHPYILQTRETFVLATYVGPGARIIQYADGRESSFFALGLRAVGGLLFDFESPLDAFFEVAGVLEYGFADDEGFGLSFNASGGVRYYF